MRKRQYSSGDWRAWSLILASTGPFWFHLGLFGRKLSRIRQGSHRRRGFDGVVPEGISGKCFAVMPVKWSVWKWPEKT